ncbi:hypothetical protein AAFF_G00213980 [Aldrovandia affinis]|uniref:Uncharacterized protein n=1 Tax=Aldrovandia affinis TaxID=143900 RepID=A0AAD7RGD8_9TELE|nr:hypothetical protein AAFF_G00213980 [Aldrovandia affinis]
MDLNKGLGLQRLPKWERLSAKEEEETRVGGTTAAFLASAQHERICHRVPQERSARLSREARIEFSELKSNSHSWHPHWSRVFSAHRSINLSAFRQKRSRYRPSTELREHLSGLELNPATGCVMTALPGFRYDRFVFLPGNGGRAASPFSILNFKLLECQEWDGQAI